MLCNSEKSSLRIFKNFECGKLPFAVGVFETAYFCGKSIFAAIRSFWQGLGVEPRVGFQRATPFGEVSGQSPDENMELNILTHEDIPALVLLEQRCFTCPWSEKSFIGAFNSPFTVGFGLFEEGALIGYAFLFALFEEGEVMNIALAPEMRGRGLSKLLMDALIGEAQARQVEILRLEVRLSNAPARALYEQYGFTNTGVRKGYYSMPKEDALLMELVLEGP